MTEQPMVLEPRRRGSITRRIAVAVGIDVYRSWGRLRNAARDARDVAAVLEAAYGFEVRRLLDAEATREAVEAEVRTSLEGSAESTQWLFYFAGHGAGKGDNGFLIPADGSEREASSQLPVRWLLEACLGSRCGETLIVLDACYSGQAMIEPDFRSWLHGGRAAGAGVRQLVTAGAPDQHVFDGGGGDHSVFTRCLLDALEGYAGLHEEAAAAEGSPGNAGASIRFTPLLDWIQSAVAERLRAQGWPPDDQRVLGGSLTQSRASDFTFDATVPLIPATVVRGTRDASGIKSLASLRLLAELPGKAPRRSLKLAAQLAAQFVAGGRPFELPTSDHKPLVEGDAGGAEPAIGGGGRIREQAAKTLGKLAASESPAGELGVEDPLLCLALRDAEPAVRDRARRALNRLPTTRRSNLADRLLEWWAMPVTAIPGYGPEREKKRQCEELKRRLWHLIICLPESRRRLRAATRVGAAASLAGLSAARAWRWIERRRTLRRLAAVSSLAAGLFYAGVAAHYYLSTSGTSIVVRRGVPGLEFLPAMGSVAVATDFAVEEIEDAAPVVRHRVRGLWPRLEEGMLGWGPQLGERLRPAPAALAFWRWGDLESALRQLRRGMAAADPASLEAALYIAAQDEAALPPIAEMVMASVAPLSAASDLAQRLGLTSPVDAAQDAVAEDLPGLLSVFRDLHPRATAAAAGSLGTRLPASTGLEAWVLIEAVAAFGANAPRAQLQALDKGLDLLSSDRLEPWLAARIAGAVERLLEARPSLSARSVPRLAEIHARSPAADRAGLLALLDLPPAAGRAARQAALEVLLDAVRGGSPAERIAAGEILSDRLAANPSEKPAIATALAALLDDPVPEVRLAAASSAAEMPPQVTARGPAVEQTRQIALGAGGDDSRRRAIEVLMRLSDAATAHRVEGTLIGLSADASVRIRAAAVTALGQLGLQRTDLGEIETALRRALEDPSPGVRQAAARGLLFLADRLAGDLGPALDEVIDSVTAIANLMPTEELGRQLGSRSPAAVGLLARAIVQRLERTPADRSYFLIELLQSAVASSAELSPSSAEALTELLASDTDADWVFSALSSAGNVEHFANRLFQLLQNPEAGRRRAAAKAVGLLVYYRRELVAKAAAALAPALQDPELEVRLSAARALQTAGGGERAALLSPLLGGLAAREPELRLACARALQGLARGEPPPASLPPALDGALADSHPPVRGAVAQALKAWSRDRPRGISRAVERLRRRLLIEPEPEVRAEVAAALAVAAGDTQEVADSLVTLARGWLDSGDPRLKSGAVRVLRDLGEAHGAEADRAIETLGIAFAQAEEPKWVLLAVRDVGIQQQAGGRAALDFMIDALGNESYAVRWDAVMNGLEPLARFQPPLSRMALDALDRALSQGLGVGDVRDQHFLTARVDIGRALVVHDPETLWPRLESGAAHERRLGHRMLLHLVTERPELEPQILKRLDRLRRSLRPHVRQSASLAAEMLLLLRQTEDLLHDPVASRRWSQLLDRLSFTELEAGVEVAGKRISDADPGI